jgi:prepilin-type N-terminal cleavage/methylation domain-containing protein
MWNETGENIFANSLEKRQNGFSLIEAVVAIFILTIGLMGTAAALSYAIHYGTISRNVTNAKSIIVGQIEEIETLRNSRRLDFKQIANTGTVDNTDMPAIFSGFSTGFKELSINPGPDGVNGTDDDLRDAGPDATFGTGDDFDNPALVRSGYMREITITNLSASMKKIEIKVRYYGTGESVGEIAGVCYLNDEGRLTR